VICFVKLQAFKPQYSFMEFGILVKAGQSDNQSFKTEVCPTVQNNERMLNGLDLELCHIPVNRKFYEAGNSRRRKVHNKNTP